MERDTADDVEGDGADHIEEGVQFAPYSPWSGPPAPRPSTAPSTAPDQRVPDHRVPAAEHDPPVHLPRRGASTRPVRHAPPEPPADSELDQAGPDATTAVPVHPYPEIEVPLTYSAPVAEDGATRPPSQVRQRLSRRARDRGVALSAVRRAFGGLRQITVVNPKGEAGKTVATLLLGLTYGQARGGFVLAWDNNEAEGTLGTRAQPAMHARTVRDLLRDLDRFAAGDRIAELGAYVWVQHEAMFDVLACAAAGEMVTARAFREIREVVGRSYKLIIVDTGNNVRAENWQAAVDATDQLVVTVSARNDSAESAARLLDHLEQSGRRELVRRAAVVVTLPPHRKDVNPDQIERHFDARCRVVLRVPHDRHLDSGVRVQYDSLSPQSRRSWLHAAAAIADGL